MDEAGRARLLRLAEYMAAVHGVFASRDVAEILRAIDALDALDAAIVERDAARAEAARLRDRLHRAEKHERELADALEFYGDEGIYDMVLMGGGVFRRIRTIMQDHGARARAALAAADMAPDATEEPL